MHLMANKESCRHRSTVAANHYLSFLSIIEIASVGMMKIQEIAAGNIKTYVVVLSYNYYYCIYIFLLSLHFLKR